jgi:isochorismate synthase
VDSIQDLNNWISDGKDYFFQRKPGATNVDAFALGNETNLGRNTVVICPFESNTPRAFTISLQWELSPESLTSLTINLAALPQHENSISTTKSQYVNNVNTALQAISNKQFEKVVIAQTLWIKLSDTSVITSFLRACKSPDSYVYLLRLNGSIWIGASPEIFLKSDYNMCETVALAGTRLSSKSNEDWGDKEVQEQLIVGEYIASSFAQLGLKNIKIGGQFTKTVGHIQHICNRVSAQLSEDVHWTKLVTKLHPTPALAGFPKSSAIDFILNLEDFKRKLYGGVLGVMGEHGIDLFVNIRCAELFSNGARLYAGAGINQNSIPESEWDETQNKLEVMRSILT